MRTQIWLTLYVAVLTIVACSPDDFTYNDFSNYKIDKVVCQAQSNYLVADDYSELNLEVKLYVKKGEYIGINGEFQNTYEEIPQERWRTHEINFYMEDGTPVSNPYKASSANPQKLRFYATVDGIRSSKPILQLEAENPPSGTPLVAFEPEPVCFEVNVKEALPLSPKRYIPVVFHLVDSDLAVKAGQGIDNSAVYYVIELWNNVFGRKYDKNSYGANPNIEFVPVLQDPKGNRLKYPGINRVSLTSDEEAKFVSQKVGYIWNNPDLLYWDCDRYLNVWVFYSDITMATTDLLKKCYPTLFPDAVNTDLLPLPALIRNDVITRNATQLENWKKNPGTSGIVNHTNPEKVGIVFSKNSFAQKHLDYVGLMGVYLGVIINAAYSDNSQRYYGTSSTEYLDDQCDDTPVYDIWFWGSGGREESAYGSPQIKYMREAPWIIYKSTNIAENYSAQSTISLEQVKRIDWVLEHAAGRQAWKDLSNIMP